MEPIWAAGACTAADVIKQLRATHDWNHSTIRTLLARLVEKGALAYDVDGSRYIYRAAVSRQQCVRQEGRSFLEKAFGGDVAALLAHFVDGSVAGSGPDRATPSIARSEEESQGETEMITLLDTLGPAIWRASWQAAALALLVVLLLRCFGERLSPRWRFLLWGVVLARLLFVATPVSPWSVFNLVRWNPEANARPIAQREADATFTPAAATGPTRRPARTKPNVESPRVADSAPESSRRAGERAPRVAVHFLRDRDGIDAVRSRACSMPSSITRILSSFWLAGCLLLGLEAPGDRARPASASFGLPSRDGCRRSWSSWKHRRRRVGLKRTPALLVTPESPEPLHRGDLESQDCPAGIGRDGIFDRRGSATCWRTSWRIWCAAICGRTGCC